MLSTTCSSRALTTVSLKCGSACRRDGVILIAAAATDANRADHYSGPPFEGTPPAKIMTLPSFDA